MERLKTTTESLELGETNGQKLSQFRNKINEIVDYINVTELTKTESQRRQSDIKKMLESIAVYATTYNN